MSPTSSGLIGAASRDAGEDRPISSSSSFLLFFSLQLARGGGSTLRACAGVPARLRLKQRREFLRVQRGGRKHHLRHFMVFAARRPVELDPENPGEPLPTRLGITVTRKVGNAVTRNRIKRLVREVFRQHRRRLPSGLDVVWVAKQQAADASFAEVLADFEALARRGDLTAPEPDRGQRRTDRRNKKPKRP